MFQKPNREVYSVFVHCSASDNPDHDKASVIKQWHLDRGWSDIGYHYFIRKNGALECGRGLERTPAAQKGHNTGSIAICMHGLLIEKFTESQLLVLGSLCRTIDEAYDHDITFHGHNEVNLHKTCPVINVKEVLNLDEQGYIKYA
jgi:N-acetylmuramoyl-L-alanine amidase